jgi:hypothetical protein
MTLIDSQGVIDTRVVKNYFPTLVAAVDRRLAPAGWRKRQSAIWTQRFDERFSGWFGLNHGWYPSGDSGSIGLVLTVGVRDEEVERILAQLEPSQTGPIRATAVENIDVLRPQDRRGTIYVDGPRFVEAAAETVADQIRTEGLPFARSLATLPALIDGLRRHGRHYSVEYRLPIALYLTGDDDAVRAALRSSVEYAERWGGKGVADAVRSYAASFFSRIEPLVAR